MDKKMKEGKSPTTIVEEFNDAQNQVSYALHRLDDLIVAFQIIGNNKVACELAEIKTQSIEDVKVMGSCFSRLLMEGVHRAEENIMNLFRTAISFATQEESKSGLISKAATSQGVEVIDGEG